MAGFLPEHLPCSSIERMSIMTSRSSCLGSTHTILTSPPPAVNPVSKKQNALVERRSMLFRLQSGRTHLESGKAKHRLGRTRDRKFFRCDIHAVSADDERSARSECKQMIREAGGVVMNEYQYLGGFLFELPRGGACPLESGDLTAKGGSIVVEPWQPFSLADEHTAAEPRPAQDEDKRASRRLSGRLDDFFGRRKSQIMQAPNSSRYTLSRESLDDDVTLMDMLLESQAQQPEARTSVVVEDAADWITLSSESADEDELIREAPTPVLSFRPWTD